MKLEDNIFKLNADLTGGSYEHGGYSSFYICDPKRRHIHKASVRDRLLHHAVHRVIEPFWDKRFIHDSWSSRIGKGTHRAVSRLNELSFKLSGNHSKTLWALKLDIKKFFASVDHVTLLAILGNKTHDIKLMQLFREIIVSFEPGLPLGNLTSQLFANIFLDKFDKYAKHELGVFGYVRYADDCVLLEQNREKLENYLVKIEAFLDKELRLKLHPQKVSLETFARGIDFLGYVCFPHFRVLRTKTKRRMLKNANIDNLSSYLGVLKHCRSRGLRKALEEKAKPTANPRQSAAGIQL